MKVWTEIDDDRAPIRVFRSQKEMILAMPYAEDGYAVQMDRHTAVGSIRERIWQRQDGSCIRCPNLITAKQMHMHEREHRGRGGDISLENSEGLCYPCHLGQRGVHPEKQLRFTSRTEKA